MQYLIVALGLMFAIEGALYAAFPQMMRRIMSEILAQSDRMLRLSGLTALGLGYLLVWLAHS